MDRRTFGASLLGGLAALGAAPAMAQRRRPMGHNMAMGPAEQRHALDTLAIGNVALLSSRLASSRGNHQLVRQFAQFETEEQTTVAQIINELSGLTPPPPPPADRAALDRLQRASGSGFDRDYLAAQLDGHRRLLSVQERYLGQGRNTDHRHLAMLARGRIQEHIRELELIRSVRS